MWKYGNILPLFWEPFVKNSSVYLHVDVIYDLSLVVRCTESGYTALILLIHFLNYLNF